MVTFYMFNTSVFKICNLCRAIFKVEKCIGPLVPENFEVFGKYFKLPFVCKIFQVNLHMGFLTIFYMILCTLFSFYTC